MNPDCPKSFEHGTHAPDRPCCRRGAGSGLGTMVEPAVLAALMRKPAHGYDLRREIKEITGGAIEVDVGGLYRALRRMEGEGFVTSTWASGDSGPQRREYVITEEGRDLAQGWIAHLRERQRVSGLLGDVLEAVLGDDREESR